VLDYEDLFLLFGFFRDKQTQDIFSYCKQMGWFH